MFHIISAAVILLLAVSPQKVAAEEVSHTVTTQHGKLGNDDISVPANTDGSAKAIPSLSASKEMLGFRRSAHFYSWHGSCYTQDRHQNWYQVDARLC